jgi:hypothetical protein
MTGEARMPTDRHFAGKLMGPHSPAVGDRIMRNKANLKGASSLKFPVSSTRPGPERSDFTLQTSHLIPTEKRLAASLQAHPAVRNKANSREPPAGRRGPIVQNKPNLPAGRMAGTTRPTGLQASLGVRNKANSQEDSGRLTIVWRISYNGSHESCLCENKANRRKRQVAPPPPGVIPAEGGWATWRWTRRAKQSQLTEPGPGEPGRPSYRAKQSQSPGTGGRMRMGWTDLLFGI